MVFLRSSGPLSPTSSSAQVGRLAESMRLPLVSADVRLDSFFIYSKYFP